MSSNTFKRTLVSAAILASTSASAALYKVVEVSPSTTFDYKSSYGVAIQPGMVNEPLGCFDTNTAQCEFLLAGETRLVEAHAGEAVDGLSYREEAPFRLDNRFIYVQDNNDFKNYCSRELGYSICDTWASIRWNLWSAEIKRSTTPNSIAFIENYIGPLLDDSQNIVINSLNKDGDPVGIVSEPGNVTGYRRNSVQAIVGDTTINEELQTRAWKTDGIYTVGSIATANTNSQGDYYTSKGAIWKNSTDAIQVSWGSGVAAKRDQLLAQGSLRDFVISGSTLYAVGFNTFYEKYHYMQASVSLLSIDGDGSLSESKTVEVKGATVYSNGGTSGDKKTHTNSLLTSVNENLIAIGEAKRSSADKGAYNNRLFIVPDVSADSPTAAFLSGGIFFDGAGGKAGAINNYNEMVGQIDADNTREVSGKPRRKRGFIYPYNGIGTDSERRRAIFDNQAWWLDDLTNGGDLSNDNNQYRIIDATDINDAGVIAATAFKCNGGYDSTAHNATCSNQETTVAVKLIPIAGATSSDIVQRGTDEQSTERKGAAVGLWALILLGLFGFRRK
ncbi:DUF3466 family protein [Vibrio cincinnatiensis]|uniref:DUF3466 family protein n=1 Tax=Vibrio cincinnatiensis TaxID=675 RepID=UPI001EDF7ED3|nr:DUF3466 family protein [Vibrio cincinnatiensis]MCG3722061.1 DUF3466 family protein [Vibrio cincinnatiensis]MCG3735512.1 DUF3466 family protein [Vibrio cincinnatiensis]